MKTKKMKTEIINKIVSETNLSRSFIIKSISYNRANYGNETGLEGVLYKKNGDFIRKNDHAISAFVKDIDFI